VYDFLSHSYVVVVVVLFYVFKRPKAA